MGSGSEETDTNASVSANRVKCEQDGGSSLPAPLLDHGWLVFIPVMLITMGFTLRVPNKFAMGHWLFNYDHGFIKRGLPGFVIAPLVRNKPPADIETILTFVAVVVLVALGSAWILFCKNALGNLRASPALWLGQWSATVLFFGSSLMVITAYCIGYFDQLLLFLLVCSFAALLRNRYLLAGLLGASAIFVHELFAMFVPMLALAAWVRLGAAEQRDQLRRGALLLLPMLAALLLVVLSTRWTTPERIAEIRAELTAYNLDWNNKLEHILYHLKYSFAENWTQQAPSGWARLTDPYSLRPCLPTLLGIGVIGAACAWRVRGALGVAFYVVAALMPLTLHWLAWDSGRISCLMLAPAYLGGAVMAMESPQDQGFNAPWKTFAACGAAVLLALAGIGFSWTHLPAPFGGDPLKGQGLFLPRSSLRDPAYHCARPLFENADFERGDLKGWEAQGNAFTSQPLRGIARADVGHQGRFWIGSNRSGKAERYGMPGTIGDKPQGTLVSRDFTLAGDSIVFLISGGSDPQSVYAALEVEGVEVARATGHKRDSMQLVTWPVAAQRGKSARLRIVDQSEGAWGHINVDGFCY